MKKAIICGYSKKAILQDFLKLLFIKKFLQKYLSFILSGAIILGLVGTYFYYEPFQAFVDQTWSILMSENHEKTKEYFKDFGFWGPVAIIVFIILQMFLLIFPSWLPIIVAVLAYGFWWGVLINLVGIGIASSLGYYIGDKLENTIFRSFMSKKKSDKMKFWITKYLFWNGCTFQDLPFLFK
ncbi:VTT domain-containing protein [Salinimicrobium sp. GXAS 041]|uniref:VTT domain-containing protein n=1 Tax=Salinimicrobium sp. GXAS 041 TaxID=3400806 RepID=UPI003C77A700